MDCRFESSLNLDDVSCASLFVIRDIDVALCRVEIEKGNALHIQPPARILARTKGIVDHVADGGDLQITETHQRLRFQLQQLVGPKDIRFLELHPLEDVTIETVYPGPCLQSMQSFAEQGLLRFVCVRIQRYDRVTESLESPDSILRGIVRGQAGCVEDCKRPALLLLQKLVLSQTGNDLFRMDHPCHTPIGVENGERSQIVFIEELCDLLAIRVHSAAHGMPCRRQR